MLMMMMTSINYPKLLGVMLQKTVTCCIVTTGKASNVVLRSNGYIQRNFYLMNKVPTRCNKSSLFFFVFLLYMFRALHSPIIRSLNCTSGYGVTV
jgi:hypothetical protein